MRNNPRKSVLRQPRYEDLEARLFLTAQPAGDFIADYVVEADADSLLNDAFHEINHLAAADDLTGLTEARNAYGLDGTGQTIAVIDSGIAYDHYALGGGFGSGYRVVGGWDFAEDDADPYDDAAAGSHGTHVAGIIGSSDAIYDGVAPGVDLVALRVFNDYGAGYFEWVEDALQWVHTNRNAFESPITAVNLSLGADWNEAYVPDWAMLEDEFAQLESDGIFVAVAAGNSFLSYNQPGLGYPAVSPYVVPVSSVDDDGSLSYFSQRHDRAIAAPGRGVTSTVPDYVGNSNGLADDFASYSGTSMATPYVAGASALIREAFSFAGRGNVTQDEIYDVMRATADLVWDDATSQYYSRLNLSAALDFVMPDDEYGSTASSATGLGDFADLQATGISGMVNRLDDVDYFRFTASETGKLKLSPAAENTSWMVEQLPAGYSIDDTGALSFDAVSGQQYVIGVAAHEAITHYQIDVSLVSVSQAPSSTDWGVVFDQTIANQAVSSESWYQVTAGNRGILTLQALFDHAGGDVDLEVYSEDHRLLDSSTSHSDNERVDVQARAGDTLLVKAIGNNGNVDFRLLNIVQDNGSQLVIRGTNGDDVFSYNDGDQARLTVNGVKYTFDTTSIDRIVFRGSDGSDRIRVLGTDKDDNVNLQPGSLTFKNSDIELIATDFENVRVYSRGGNDTATLGDSSGNDRFIAKPHRAVLRGDGFVHYVDGYANVVAHSSKGTDYAYFHDSATDDSFTGRPDYASLVGEGFHNEAHDFERAVGMARAGGTDSAALYRSSGQDAFVSNERFSFVRNDDFYNRAQGFDTVHAFAATTAGTSVAAKGHITEDPLDSRAINVDPTVDFQGAYSRFWQAESDRIHVSAHMISDAQMNHIQIELLQQFALASPSSESHADGSVSGATAPNIELLDAVLTDATSLGADMLSSVVGETDEHQNVDDLFERVGDWV